MYGLETLHCVQNCCEYYPRNNEQPVFVDVGAIDAPALGINRIRKNCEQEPPEDASLPVTSSFIKTYQFFQFVLNGQSGITLDVFCVFYIYRVIVAACLDRSIPTGLATKVFTFILECRIQHCDRNDYDQDRI
ncbi:hypothetical protein FR483_n017L [Paramecium bursaria Chlorella virus FR483]|uniref:Uncharacterized protein n017L n=1 Tax=Paramecium bursaria Chlorella virus FR483 TaxID=399781 RepID=A7J671_PBCVF|nr:hypothetical protein FR483_n017L [Paramecium bursaria Chlorella virus FR483]ABT15302.1 hypothetical protein FR483_n017L [Paramecium bursaria Chlorella virus FR483]